MKKIYILLLFFVVSNFYSQDKILGKWLTADKRAHIQIYKQNEKYFGKIVWIKDLNNPETGKPWTDKANPDSKLKNRQVLGITMLNNFIFDKKSNQYIGGSLYDARKGETYKGKMWLSDDNTLEMRGYVWVFYQTEKWTRVID